MPKAMLVGREAHVWGAQNPVVMLRRREGKKSESITCW